MRYNPCGRIVDIVARTYQWPCHFLRDNDQVGTVQWRDARPDALTLDDWSVICSLDYEPDKELPYPVGELPRTNAPFRLGTAPVGSGRGHVCGTPTDFHEGGLYLPDLPPVQYAANGLPICCDPAFLPKGGAGAGGKSAVVIVPAPKLYGGAGASGRSAYVVVNFVDPTAGGIEFGGSAGESRDYVDPTAGGVEFGGAAGESRDYLDPTAGGVEFGGSAGESRDFVDPTAGGVEFGGSAGESRNYLDPTAGGIEFGGSAGESRSFVDPSAGGIEFGGEAGDTIAYLDPTEGGIEFGGEAGDQVHHYDPTAGGIEFGGAAGDDWIYADPTAGGVEFGGSAGESRDYVDPTAGGVEFGGSAGESYTTPAPAPGATCAAASVFPNHGIWSGLITGANQNWWSLTPPLGATVVITIVAVGGGTLRVTVTSNSCAAPITQAGPTDFTTPGVMPVSVTWGGTTWFKLIRQAGGPTNYTIFASW